MHAVMITSRPALLYWQPATGIDAGGDGMAPGGLASLLHGRCRPQRACDLPSRESPRLQTSLTAFPGVERVLTARPGGPARLIQSRISLESPFLASVWKVTQGQDIIEPINRFDSIEKVRMNSTLLIEIAQFAGRWPP
jgi:hypothetical protein